MLPPASPRDEQPSRGGIQKPRRGDGWLLAVGAVILLGLLGHVFNQQRVSRQTSDPEAVERPQRESAPTPAAEAPSPDATRRTDTENLRRPAAPTRVVYMVTHKHRLRDCHGSLTFTRKNLRFDSDEPEDSFDVGIDEVTIDDDVVRIDNKPWRFEFSDGVRVDRLFNDWKAGILTPVPAP